jgi:hypothetical protein
MQLHLSITADSREELEELFDLMAKLAQQPGALPSMHGLGAFPPGMPIIGESLDEIFGMPQASEEELAATEPPKRKRGRPKKEEPTPPEEPASNDLPPGDNSGLSALDDLLAKPEAKTKSPLDLLDAAFAPQSPAPLIDGTNLSPEEQRTKGAELLLDLVNTNESRGKVAVRKLLDKYDVKSFSAIPLDRAGEFLADAIMGASTDER